MSQTGTSRRDQAGERIDRKVGRIDMEAERRDQGYLVKVGQRLSPIGTTLREEGRVLEKRESLKEGLRHQMSRSGAAGTIVGAAGTTGERRGPNIDKNPVTGMRDKSNLGAPPTASARSLVRAPPATEKNLNIRPHDTGPKKDNE